MWELTTVCFSPLLIVIGLLALLSIRIVNEWEVGIVLTLGKYSRTLKPGLNFIIPLIERVIIIDTRIQTIDIPPQEVMTKDNVPVKVNAVVYMRVEDPKKAVLKITNYWYAVSQYAQTALRDVIGEVELDNLLMNREEIAEKIKNIVDQETVEWGVDIVAIKLQDIELPADMKRAMARQAEAERERRAAIILSSGEVKAAENLKKAAEILKNTPTALHLRTLQTLTDISSDPSTKIIVTLPVEVLEYFARKPKKK